MDFSFGPFYKLGARGDTRVWSIKFDGTKIISTSGQLGGKMTERSTQVKLNTSGRNLEEQARLEMNKRVTDKKREGFVEELENVADTRSRSSAGSASQENSEVLPLPMLAHPYEQKRVTFPILAQPKIDGVRMICKKVNGKVIAQSRKTKQFVFLDDIKSDVDAYLDETDYILDGEVYSFTLTFNELSGISRASKNRSKNEDKMVYLVYDLINNELDAKDRMEVLGIKIKNWSTSKPKTNNQSSFVKKLTEKIFLVNTYIIENEEELLDLEERALQGRFEGLIIRHLEPSKAKYENKRTYNLLKLKREKDAEGTIVGFKTEENNGDQLVIWEVEDVMGNVSSMRPLGTHEDRKKLLAEANKYIGKTVTYRFFEYEPKTKVPRFARVVRIRDELDETGYADDEPEQIMSKPKLFKLIYNNTTVTLGYVNSILSINDTVIAPRDAREETYRAEIAKKNPYPEIERVIVHLCVKLVFDGSHSEKDITLTDTLIKVGKAKILLDDENVESVLDSLFE